jgi:hypothetical protein
MVATDDQRNFAASTINYFNIDLKGGANDKLKALVKATQQTAAAGIATAISNAKTITEANKNDAVTKAVVAFTTAQTAKTNADTTATTAATELIAATQKDADAKTAATTADSELQAATQKDTTAKVALSADPDNTTLQQAAAQAATELTAATLKDTTAKTTATTAATDLQTATQKDADATTAATTAATELQAATLKDTTAKTTATTAANDLQTATENKAEADAIKVGDDPVMTAAKAYITACGSKITDFAQIKDTDVITCSTELLKNYGLINAILKNLPNKADTVLTSASNAFNGYAANLNDSGNTDKLKAANAYFKIAVTVTGSEPFATGDAIPEPKSYTNHATHVEQSLDQLNAMSYALLQDINCGSANKADLSGCYKVHATDLKAIFNPATIDNMNIDVSAKYPFEDAFKGNADLPVIE